MDYSIHRPLKGSSGRLGCQGVRTVRSCDKRRKMMYCKAFFGGAIVTKLAGSAKIVKGERVVVPLLGPGNGPLPRLPFGASLECIQKLPHHEIPRSEPISKASHVNTTNNCGSTTPLGDSTSRMLDIFYVLAGTGVVTTADGSLRKLHSGDSLIAWHNTTVLCADSPDHPPAVLKFHFPSHILVLPPGTEAAPAPSHADLAVLVTESQGPAAGQVSQQEAADIMRGVQQRTSRAIDRLYGSFVEGSERVSLGDALGNAATAGVGSDGHVGRGDAGGEIPDRMTSTAHDQRINIAAIASDNNGNSKNKNSNTGMPAVVQHQQARAATLLRGLLPRAVSPLGFLRRLLEARYRTGDVGVTCGRDGGDETPGCINDSRQHLGPGPAQPPPPEASAVATAAGTESSNSSSSCGGPSGAALPGSDCVLLQRALEDFKAFRFPRQTNKLAFVFDPSELGLSLSFGVEVFEPGHRTPLHIHRAAHELFFVLGGAGIATCNGQSFPVAAGDVVVFPPRTVHGIDNPSSYDKLYCLQLMTPNEAFVEHVKSGEAVGRLDYEDLCNLTSRHC